MGFQIYLIRHGQTILNKYNKFQGWSDSPLTKIGINDARNTGNNLKNIKFDAAYCSDCLRTINTCKIILSKNKFNKPKIHQLKYFREQYFGYFEGEDSGHIWTMVGLPHNAKNYNELINKLGFEKTRDLLHKADPFKDAENSLSINRRIYKGMKLLQSKYNKNENILLVSHAITICNIINNINPNIKPYLNIPRNGSVTKLIFNNKKFIVEYFNKTNNNDIY